MVVHFAASYVSLQECINKNYTLPETNISPENRHPQKESDLRTTIFQVLC